MNKSRKLERWNSPRFLDRRLAREIARMSNEELKEVYATTALFGTAKTVEARIISEEYRRRAQSQQRGQ